MVAFVVIWLVAMLAVAASGRRGRRLLRPLAARVRIRLEPWLRRRLHRRPPAPVGRPIEEIARDVQRLALLVHYPAPHLSFARFEGRRRAYDTVLGEACRALGVPHLLEVLPPGPEHDRERERVELVLDWAGLRLDDVA
jgi:hypothetical protein